ncbi:hypothetical protein BW730_02450 [Tessaracoccus aquimaris]|uniref:Uncharacterized protein n=1 Tax=Tessaracoccus aquimaris TaxID=1332264 RepID=A0A1Q2CKB3_9ACTN|nr:hypothetical protein [Tessaracoccus aquimaris]AQP46569.1 hypothetical protein BW730_02450 [Tessaracoccus aquimaris]
MRRPLRATAAALALSCLALAGCSTGGVDIDSKWSLAASLEQVPSTAVGSPRFVVAGDLEGAGRAGGFDPHDEKNAQRLLGLDSAVYLPFPELPTRSDPAVVEKLAGFDLLDADRYVANGQGAQPFTVAMGDLGPDTLPDSLKDLGDGVRSDLDGEDGAPNIAREGIDQIGRPIRFAAKKHAIAMSTSTPLVRDWLGDDGPTLADDKALVEVAKALDGEDVFSAILTDPMPMAPDLTATPGSAAQQMEALEKATPATPFDTIGIGWKRGQVVVAYRFAEEPDVAALEAIWRDGTLFTTQSPIADRLTVASVTAKGNVGIVTLDVVEGSSPALAEQMLLTREPVFVTR